MGDRILAGKLQVFCDKEGFSSVRNGAETLFKFFKGSLRLEAVTKNPNLRGKARLYLTKLLKVDFTLKSWIQVVKDLCIGVGPLNEKRPGSIHVKPRKNGAREGLLNAR